MCAPRARERVELERGESLLHHRAGLLGDRLGLAAPLGPPVGVDAKASPHRAAEQVVDGLADGLADDVPERLLHAADRRVEVHGAALGAEVGVGHEREVLDVERTPADEVAPELSHVRLDGPVAIGLRVAFPPAVEPRIRLDLHEQPALVRAGIDEERPDRRDLHVASVRGPAPRERTA
jgi:hypothetical protein